MLDRGVSLGSQEKLTSALLKPESCQRCSKYCEDQNCLLLAAFEVREVGF